ncbi:hypothetical protein OG232_04560 [Streptomyces sp. NBC_01411]|uniref:hypothetical protein n=1 Tax=Streptomyces sp. NBC_01411 TaxID=2903857 RepID=UPI003245D1BC
MRGPSLIRTTPITLRRPPCPRHLFPSTRGAIRRRSICHFRGVGLLQLDELGFEISDALVGEAAIGSGTFKSFLERALLLAELADALPERCVLHRQVLYRFAGGHLVEVAPLAHEFPDSLPQGEDLLLRTSQLALGVESALAPGRLDSAVFFAGALKDG